MPREEDQVCIRSTLDAQNFWAKPRNQNQISPSFRIINNTVCQNRNLISNQTYQQFFDTKENNTNYNSQPDLQNQYLSKLKQMENDSFEMNQNLEMIKNNQLNILDISHDSFEDNNVVHNSLIESFHIKQEILINEIKNLELKFQQLETNYNQQIKKLLKINSALVKYITQTNI